MAVSLTVYQGRPCIEITDYRGEVWAYQFDILAADEGLYQVRLLKRDGMVEPAYLVTHHNGQWRCECPHYTYRPSVRFRGCKHIEAARELQPFAPLFLPGVSA